MTLINIQPQDSFETTGIQNRNFNVIQTPNGEENVDVPGVVDLQELGGDCTGFISTKLLKKCWDQSVNFDLEALGFDEEQIEQLTKSDPAGLTAYLCASFEERAAEFARIVDENPDLVQDDCTP